MPQISVRLLCPHDSQDSWLFDCRDTITHSSTSRSCTSALSNLRLPIRPPRRPLSFYLPWFLDHYDWTCNSTDHPPQLPRAIPGHMFRRHGLLLRRSHHHLLVPHESGWT